MRVCVPDDELSDNDVKRIPVLFYILIICFPVFSSINEETKKRFSHSVRCIFISGSRHLKIKYALQDAHRIRRERDDFSMEFMCVFFHYYLKFIELYTINK